ncbi:MULTISPECIES: arsenate reductase/protein-tyrosine-phosphatase family protein [Raoultella]|uniref:arsenate reductase/protein-tyrosine-phosphatase family protein n=1 Tax=Raoultella TaxID=160674 RepID=UPI003890E8A3
MFNKLLVVCVGNICRSPTGEALLSKYCKNKIVISAGLSALSGHNIDKMAKTVAHENGLIMGNHIAKQLTADLCQENDLILVMEKKHIDEICKLAPECRGKIMLFGHWISQEIPDPYKKSKEAFQHVYRILDEAAVEWSTKL